MMASASFKAFACLHAWHGVALVGDIHAGNIHLGFDLEQDTDKVSGLFVSVIDLGSCVTRRELTAIRVFLGEQGHFFPCLVYIYHAFGNGLIIYTVCKGPTLLRSFWLGRTKPG